MASGRLFDPLVALRIAPLVSSTCTLLFARDQQFFLGILNHTEIRKQSKPLLSSYFKIFFRSGVVFVLGCLIASTATGIANIYTQRADLEVKDSFWWYTAGAALAASHLVYVPMISPSIQALREPRSNTDVNKSLDEWLSINLLRTVTVDLGAFLAFFVAVAKTLRV